MDDGLRREQPTALFAQIVEPRADECTSDALILTRLHGMLFANNQIAPGLGEKTLQLIITRLAAAGRLNLYAEVVPRVVVEGLTWTVFPCPSLTGRALVPSQGIAFPDWKEGRFLPEWASHLSCTLSLCLQGDVVLGPLRRILSEIHDFAVEVLPALVHRVLLSDTATPLQLRQKLSNAFRDMLMDHGKSRKDHLDLVIRTLLYLRCQPLPQEARMSDRNSWLEIDYSLAAAAAVASKAYKTGLLFLELQASQLHLHGAPSSRRASAGQLNEPHNLMQSIFQNLDDPDFFYGVEEQASLDSVVRKLGHETEGFKYLSFQSAVYDSQVRCSNNDSAPTETSGLFQALSVANLDGLARSVQMHSDSLKDTAISDAVLRTGLNLQQWDIPALPSQGLEAGNTLGAFHKISILQNGAAVPVMLDGNLLAVVDSFANKASTGQRLCWHLATLAILAETRDTLMMDSYDDMGENWTRLTRRGNWMENER